MRAKLYASTACYLIQDNKVLFIKFNKKWGNVYAPPGGKLEEGETPTECVTREFKEETGLEIKNPKLKGISYWNDGSEGIIYIYEANQCDGYINESDEGKLEWIDIEKIKDIEQFEMNKKFTDYIFEDGIFEGKFILDDKSNVKEYKIVKI